jgi:NADPH:quinone reductase-like Zn-dependent oxidoreductase
MTTMRAVRAHKRGGPEQLVYENAPRPEPAAGEVLVAVHAASITNGELAWDATWTDSFDGSGSDRTPVVPSHEVSGVVAEVGPGVTGLSVGDEVYGLIPFTRDGATAEYVTVPADVLAVKPSRLNHASAAAVPLAALTAWQALVGKASLESGQHVLVHGGAGGVGSFAVQIAAALGARVTATASARDREFVSGLGADQVIDYADERFEDHVDGADVVLDTVGGDTQARSWAALRPGGTLVSIAPGPVSAELWMGPGAWPTPSRPPWASTPGSRGPNRQQPRWLHHRSLHPPRRGRRPGPDARGRPRRRHHRR